MLLTLLIISVIANIVLIFLIWNLQRAFKITISLTEQATKELDELIERINGTEDAEKAVFKTINRVGW